MVNANGIRPGEKPNTIWSRDLIIDALQEWAREHGRSPRMTDWTEATPFRPASQTVRERFGTWSAGVRAAGLVPHKPGAPPTWTKKMVAEALLDWYFEKGRWPSMKEWDLHTHSGRPHVSAIRRLFGSWNAAKRYAGWAPRCVVCSGELPRRRPDHLYCSRSCKHVVEQRRAKSGPGVLVESVDLRIPGSGLSAERPARATDCSVSQTAA